MKKNLARADRPPPAGKIYNPKRPTRAEKMWRTMEILLKNVAYNGNPPPAGKIYNPNPPTRADPRRSSAAGRENLQSKSASVAVVAVAAVVVATRKSRLCRQSQTA